MRFGCGGKAHVPRFSATTQIEALGMTQPARLFTATGAAAVRARPIEEGIRN